MRLKYALFYAERAYLEKTGVINEVEYFIAGELYKHSRVISFRGTEFTKLISAGGIVDVIRDLMFRKEFHPSVGEAHRGFLAGAISVCNRRLIPLHTSNEPTWLIGHSMGGAIALCCAPILIAAGWNIKGVITFGAPYTLSKDAARNYPDIEVKQYILRGDPIAMLPPLFLGFSHINPIYFGPITIIPSIRRRHLLTQYIKAAYKDI